MEDNIQKYVTKLSLLSKCIRSFELGLHVTIHNQYLLFRNLKQWVLLKEIPTTRPKFLQNCQRHVNKKTDTHEI